MTFIGEHKNDILQLVMMMLMGYLLYKMVFLVAYRTYIVANWPDYRCNPMFMPLAGMLNIPDPKAENGLLTVSANFSYCLNQKMGQQMNIHLKPAHGALSDLTDAASHMTSGISDTHGALGGLQTMTLNASNGIMTKVKTAQSLLSFYVIKIKELVKKLFAVFMSMIYIMKTSENAMKGMVQGPFALGIEELACFVGTTPIELHDGTVVNISEIEVGTVLLDDNKVLGVTKSYAPLILYKYNGDVIASGSHLVYEDGSWMKIRDSRRKTEYRNDGNDGNDGLDRYELVYNLVTANNKIQINNVTYRDYCECSNSAVNNRVRNYVLKCLNNSVDNELYNDINDINDINEECGDKKDYYLTGFGSDTTLDIKGGSKKYIADIVIGEELVGVGKVTGIVKYGCEDVDQMCAINGVIMSRYNIVMDYARGEWCFAHEIGREIVDLNLDLNNNSIDIYSISTEEGVLNVGNMVFRDLNETYSDRVNSEIDNMIMSYLI